MNVAVSVECLIASSENPRLTATLVLVCPGLPFSAVGTSCDFEKDLCNFYQDKEGPGWTRVRVKANMYRTGDHTTGTGGSEACQATHPGFSPILLASCQRKIRKEGEQRSNNWWCLAIFKSCNSRHYATQRICQELFPKRNLWKLFCSSFQIKDFSFKNPFAFQWTKEVIDKYIDKLT